MSLPLLNITNEFLFQSRNLRYPSTKGRRIQILILFATTKDVRASGMCSLGSRTLGLHGMFPAIECIVSLREHSNSSIDVCSIIALATFGDIRMYGLEITCEVFAPFSWTRITRGSFPYLHTSAREKCQDFAHKSIESSSKFPPFCDNGPLYAQPSEFISEYLENLVYIGQNFSRHISPWRTPPIKKCLCTQYRLKRWYGMGNRMKSE
jgi:hypothetical protein